MTGVQTCALPISLVDTCFDPPLRLSGRVLRIEEDLLDATSTRLTLGNVAPALDPWLAAQASSSKALRDHAASWDSATQVDTAYLDAVMDRLNEQFKAGGSYKFESFELGTIYSSVPLDKDGRPTRTLRPMALPPIQYLSLIIPVFVPGC